MTEKLKIRWVYLISIVYILINSLLIAHEHYWFSVLPGILLVVLFYLFALDSLLLIITFFTPIAVIFRDNDFGLGVSLPTEPLMFGIVLVFFFKILYENHFDARISKHPVSIAIMLSLIWMFLTSITSELPWVSFKYLIARLWFVIPFYFIATQLFRKRKNIKVFLWLYLIPLMGVIFYTLINHAQYGFEEDPGHWVMTPFYNDHTAYGAVLAMFLPVITVFTINKEYTKTQRYISGMVLVLFLLATVLSYSRAAWVSVAVAVLVCTVILLRIRFWIVLSGGIVVIMLLFAFQKDIIMRLEKNKQDSSAHMLEHVQSISNISSDASNLERINRWQSALRMFKQRPFLGWGPGTYQFLYAPFQFSHEKTIISTNAGDKGNAHSEYIGPLSESGVLGMLTILAIVVLVIYTSLKLHKRLPDGELKLINLALLLGLITYFTHGFLNNFLDTDKASVPFWGFIAAIISIQVYHIGQEEKETKPEKKV